MPTKLTTVKRQSCTVSDKLRIIQFTEQHGNRAAEQRYVHAQGPVAQKVDKAIN